MSTDHVDAASAFLNAHPILSDSTAFGSSGWLWLGRAPVDTPMPFGVIGDDGTSPTFDSGEAGTTRGVVENGSFTVAIFSTSRANCGTLTRLVRQVLTDAPLAFSAGSLMHMRPTNLSVDLDPDPGPAGEDVWQGIVSFDVMIDTTY
jgi:hypothetical protein